MIEMSGTLAALGAVLLFAALAAWLKLRGRVVPRRLDGRAAVKGQEVENASRLLAIAFGVSVAAAILAVQGLMFR
jgi:hypothetical protein